MERIGGGQVNTLLTWWHHSQGTSDFYAVVERPDKKYVGIRRTMHYVPCHDDAELDDEGRGGFYHEGGRGFHTRSVSQQGTHPNMSHMPRRNRRLSWT